ncbi:MAG: heme ABC transporter substrate-binding protein IsdE [Clostridia bacterium]
MKINNTAKIAIALSLCFVLLVGCIAAFAMSSGSDDSNSESASASSLNLDEDIKIIASSTAIVAICEAMGIDLVGVPDSDLVETPEVYADLPKIGYSMSPDMELVVQLETELILSPDTLISDLQPQYENVNLDYVFMNLRSVQGMFKSIVQLGEILDMQEQADVLVAEFEAYYEEYKARSVDGEAPTVLLLMGLPGSYVVATENSYAGSLVELAGGVNVYAGTGDEFLTVSTEDMLLKDPDVILLTAHALPEDVMEMFHEEFETNEIWSHFRAVQEGQVYDLPYDYFGMSADFDYALGLEFLDGVFYDS